ncbi:MAG: hypothetical protein FJ104_05220 [Deltaproteobacteria bacterium]|nr:hypothetical protein [Deltaproteobacteria bacterium]
MCRSVWSVVLLGVVGCGGRVTAETRGEDRSATEVLAEDRPDRCAAICERLADCIGGEGRDCACDGDVCECMSSPPSIEDCTAGCQEQVDESRAAGEACAASMLDGLGCLEELTCEGVSRVRFTECEAPLDAAADCARESRPDDVLGSPDPDGPVTPGGAPDPGGAPSGCWGSAGGGSPDAPPTPGSFACEEGCGGSPERRVTCVVSTRPGLFDCTCSRDGVAGASFVTDTCASLFDRCF